MRFKATSGVQVTLLLNKKAWNGSSCKYGPQALNSLFDDNVELYLCQPTKNTRGGNSSQHSKAMIIDREVVLNGSPNLTTNGFLNNIEHLTMTKDEHIVEALTEDFEYWKRVSRKMTSADRDKMMLKDEDRKTAKIVKQMGVVLQDAPETDSADGTPLKEAVFYHYAGAGPPNDRSTEDETAESRGKTLIEEITKSQGPFDEQRARPATSDEEGDPYSSGS